MPLDENFPTYHFNRLNPKDPSRFTVSFTANGSPDEQIYNITHSTETGNTYSVTYSDAHFPTIAYASVACSLEFPLASPSADANAPKVLLPSEFTVNLFNPDFQVTVEMKHSTLKGNFWEFSMPKHSFPPPTNSQIDAGYTPPVSERLYFRWRKEGGVLSRSQLRCSLVSTANTPGSSSRDRKAGAKEPDITLAMYEGVGDKHGRGEFVVYESNFRRVDIEDLKGLDLVMVIGARVINDIWFCPTATTFNTGSEVMVGSGSKQKGKNSPPVPVLASQPVPLQAGPPPQPGTFSQRFRQHQRQGHEQSPPAYPAGSGGLTAYPPEKTNGPTPEQERAKKDQERRRIEAEQAEIHCMLAREEAQEQARKQAAINAETERLKRLYQQESRNRPQRPGPPAPVSQNTRPVQQMPTQSRYRPIPLVDQFRRAPQMQTPVQRTQTPVSRIQTPLPNTRTRTPAPQQTFRRSHPPQPARPPIVGGAGYLQPGGRLTPAVVAPEGKTLDQTKSRRKSFLGMSFGKQTKEKEEGKKASKLVKRTSGMWDGFI